MGVKTSRRSSLVKETWYDPVDCRLATNPEASTLNIYIYYWIHHYETSHSYVKFNLETFC